MKFYEHAYKINMVEYLTRIQNTKVYGMLSGPYYVKKELVDYTVDLELIL